MILAQKENICEREIDERMREDVLSWCQSELEVSKKFFRTISSRFNCKFKC